MVPQIVLLVLQGNEAWSLKAFYRHGLWYQVVTIGQFPETHLKELFLAFFPFLRGSGVVKIVFSLRCGVYCHVTPHNVLLFFQRNNKCVCLTKFSIFAQSYVHFWLCQILPIPNLT